MSADATHQFDSSSTPAQAAPRPPLARSLLKLARPTQWSKSVFVLIGPFYGFADLIAHGVPVKDLIPLTINAIIAAAAFALASSGCYVFNDLADRVADRAHPRKRKRPIAAGHVAPGQARIFGLVLFIAAAALLLLIRSDALAWVAVALGVYILNVMLYSSLLKHHVIADVMSLSLGFVLRVMGGCAAAMVEPSVWLLNVVFFLSMFLAFGKRLGERRTLAAARLNHETPAPDDVSAAIAHRRVQAHYTDNLLNMAVVVTAVITLMTYALYVKDQGGRYVAGFNLLWISVLPATYGLLRAIVMIERGEYDDPTELAVHDRPFQVAGMIFVAITVAVVAWFRINPVHQPGDAPPVKVHLSQPDPS